MPGSIGEKMEMSKYLAQSGLMPTGLNTKEKVFVALQMGHELGLSPMVAVNNIAVIRGKSAQIMDAIVRSHPDYAGITIESTDDSATVTIKRRSGEAIEEYTSTFSTKDAEKAGLLPAKADSAWSTYQKRMLKHRALAFAARDAFPDALAGMYTKEEMMDVERQPRDVTPPPEAPTELTLGEIEATYPDGVIAGVEALMAEITEQISRHGDILDSSVKDYVENEAREKLMRTAYATPDSDPLKGFQMLKDRINNAVKEGMKEQDAEQAETPSQESEEEPKGKPTFMDAVHDKRAQNATDAEIVDDRAPFGTSQSSLEGME
jgi:hypothetical protein